MKTTIRQLGYALMVTMFVAIVGVPAASAQSPTAAEKSYSSATRSRAQLVDRLEDLEKQYNRVIRRIEERKRAGALDTFAGRIELQNLLRESKTIADKLGKLQDDVGALDRRLEKERSRVLASIDSKVKQLEGQLRSANRSQRRSIINELNALKSRRSQYSAPLPEAPSLSEINDALELAEEVDPSQPEDMIAVADELQDTEDQIRRRLDAVRERLDELQRQKRLQRRSEAFRTETGFFGQDEQARSNRVIAKVSENGGQQPTSGDESAEEPTTNSGGGVNSPPTSPTESGNNAQGEATDDGALGAGDFDSVADPNGAPERQSPDLTDAPGSPNEAPSGGGSGDPFAGGGETVVIAAGADPTQTVDSNPKSVREVNAAIEGLENEKEKLEKQATELKRRANKLRKQASELQ